jgi:membrane protein implicated in regulation of membrane protease activity
VARTEPHLFGVTPPLAVLVLAVAALVVGILLAALGNWLVGGLLLVAAGLLFVLYVVVSRPGGAVDAAGERLRYAATAVGATTAARRESLRLSNELTRLRGDREQRLRKLGEAVYGEDEAETARLRQELADLDEQIAGRERELPLVAARAREQVSKAKLEVQATKMVEIPGEPGIEPPEPVRIPEPYPQPGEADAPEPARIPEPYPPPDEADIPAPPAPEPEDEGGSTSTRVKN